MNFSFSDEHNLLRESVEKLVAAEYPFEVRRALAASEAGFSREFWRKFAELGWLGLGIPEDAGGLGGGPVETAVVMEALGAGLVVEPFLATVVMGASLLKRGGGHPARPARPALVRGASARVRLRRAPVPLRARQRRDAGGA